MIPRSICAATLSVALGVACDAEPGSPAAARQPSAESKAIINHLEPPRDMVGPPSTQFASTAVDGAESYSVRVWNEVDDRVFVQSGLAGTSVPLAPEVVLPSGTYFWSVMAVRDGRPWAESGFSAFVVMEQR